MSDQGQQILDQALALPAEERLKVAELLLSSVDGEDRRKIDALWAAEAEDRLDAFERRELRSVSARDVFRQITEQGS